MGAYAGAHIAVSTLRPGHLPGPHPSDRTPPDATMKYSFFVPYELVRVVDICGSDGLARSMRTSAGVK